ncbi:hypothetical protein AFB00_29905 (plasmid) [Pseudonocardia sp. HH130630-07]|nr:hypothetical protein AFB00_29905 [Pseudonocardia sp. HH130630-07]
MFFPVSETGPALRAAQAVCAGCPLAEQCRQWATDAGEWGIWAGSTTDERRADRRRAREAAAAEASPAEVAA